MHDSQTDPVPAPVSRFTKPFTPIGLALFMACGLGATLPVQAEDTFWPAITGGKLDFMARYRFEHVDDDLKTKDANANTLRLALGYRTGSIHGFRLYGQLETVQALSAEHYFDLQNGKTSYPVIADPESTELKQLYLGYEGFADTEIRAGRQIITYRKAPFHRYIGTVLWRQNWQTFDGVSLKNTSLPDTTLQLAWVTGVNTITRKDDDVNAFFFNGKYDGFRPLHLEAYEYYLDYEDRAKYGKSNNTLGLRANGAYPLNDTVKLLYTGEFAWQTEVGDNPTSYDANYWLVEGGVKFKLDNPLNMLLLKASYEVLGSDNGTKAFITPLGTNHAFQGWADRFLATPANGIEDFYATLITKPFGAKFVAVWHDLRSEDNDFDYGTELDVLLTKSFMKHWTVGAKASWYDADSNTMNTTGTPSKDATKYWAWVQFKY